MLFSKKKEIIPLHPLICKGKPRKKITINLVRLQNFPKNQHFSPLFWENFANVLNEWSRAYYYDDAIKTISFAFLIIIISFKSIPVIPIILLLSRQLMNVCRKCKAKIDTPSSWISWPHIWVSSFKVMKIW